MLNFRVLPLLAAFSCSVPQIAAAHAILVESTPHAGQTVPLGKLTITLRYNSRIDAHRSILSVSADHEAPKHLDLTADPQPNLVHASADLTPGNYTLRWQVLAIDGHITRGIVPFSVAKAATQ